MAKDNKYYKVEYSNESAIGTIFIEAKDEEDAIKELIKNRNVKTILDIEESDETSFNEFNDSLAVREKYSKKYEKWNEFLQKIKNNEDLLKKVKKNK